MTDIFDFRRKLVENYKQFSTSFASPRTPDIAKAVKEAYDNGKFWPAPLIQINPNYLKAGCIADLVASGTVEPETAEIFQTGKQDTPPHPVPLTLYNHQMAALQLVAGNKSYVVTTGTGSGKSLTFFIPIVNRIIKEKKADSTPRIRAIIVYPMNALANSQWEEINKFLDGSPHVTVKRYTGQEDSSARAELKANPPDILLTNYVMLDLILTRYQEDHEIVEAAQDLEFLVLDELHTYRGRQGADVAMLVRRIRAQLNAGKMLCIGTSATMASVGSTQDRQQAVASVASKMFDADIPAQHVVLEELEYATAAIQTSEVLAVLPARIKQPSKWATLEEFRNDPFAIWIERNLGIRKNDDGHLERAKPVTLQDASKMLAAAAACSPDEAETALKAFLTALYTKSDWPDKRVPFAFKLHQFISGPGQVMTTLEPKDKRSVELDMQRFAPSDPEQKKLLFATYFCRFCGQEYIPVWFTTGDSGAGTLVAPRDLSDNSKQKDDDEHTHPGFLCPIESLDDNSVFPCKFETSSEAMREFLPDEWFTVNKKGERVLSDAYKDRTPVAVRVLPNGQISGTDGTPYWYLPGPHTWCLNCGQTHSAAGRDTNRLVGLSGEGRSSATTILTLSALNLMYAADSGDGANKLLGFTDNRQDAALQSGHFNEFVFTVSLRAALLRALEQAPEQKLESGDVATQVFSALGFKTTKPELLAEYLENPGLVGGALQKAQQTLRFMLGFRLHADLGREWRFNNPNLEQLRLLKIKYNWINELINSDKLAGNHLLQSLSVKKRQQFAEIVLDHLRKSLCIESDYFSNEEQERQRKGGNGYLLEAWKMPSERDHLDQARDLYLFRNRKTDLDQNDATRAADRQLTKTYAVSGSYTSRLFKLLVRGHGGSGKSLWTNTEWTAGSQGTSFNRQRLPELFDAVQTLLTAANDFGIVSAANIGSAEMPVVKCRLQAEVIVWTLAEDDDGGDGDQVRADGSIRNRFYSDLYRRTAQALGAQGQRIFSYESHEHTAQVEPELREMLELRFRNKDKDREDFHAKYPEQRFKPLPVLYCSPTMELGVDISTLNMVYMRNVPPTPANYAQRSGRAGRSGQAALVVTYCTSLSPHDQWFFQRIADMVHGEVCVPALDLTNRDLVDSHLRAVWLSCVKKNLPVNISELLAMDQPGLPLKPDIGEAFAEPAALTAAKELGHRIMTRLAETEYGDGRAQWYNPDYEATVVDQAAGEFDRALDRWRSLYQSTITQLEKAEAVIKNPSVTAQERDRAGRVVQDAKNQLNVLLCQNDQGRSSTKNRDFYLYRYLASEGVLPGYSFPRLPVTAWVPRVRSTGGKTKSAEFDGGTVISRPRFLALSEFGPLSLIYHEGHTFCVRRVKLRAADIGNGSSQTIGTHTVRICPACGCAVFDTPETIGISNCQHCGAPLKSEHAIPELYQVNAVEARLQDRISLMDEERQRRGYDLMTVYGFEPGHSPSLTSVEHSGVKLATFAYAPAAKISRINLGWRRRSDKKSYGFWMDPTTGEWTGADDPEVAPRTNGDGTVQMRAKPQKIVPYVNDHRNALIITPPDDFVGDGEAIATFIAALQRGLEQVFQLESGEVAAEPVPSATNPRKILVYEASEGGAGALGRLALDVNRAQILAAVARAALEVMHYEWNEGKQDWVANAEAKNCVAGCYKCLLSYYNQPQHEKIDRRNPKVFEYLKQLARVVSTDFKDLGSPSAGLGAASAPADIPAWAPGAVAIDKPNLVVRFAAQPPPEVVAACEEHGYTVEITPQP